MSERAYIDRITSRVASICEQPPSAWYDLRSICGVTDQTAATDLMRFATRRAIDNSQGLTLDLKLGNDYLNLVNTPLFSSLYRSNVEGESIGGVTASALAQTSTDADIIFIGALAHPKRGGFSATSWVNMQRRLKDLSKPGDFSRNAYILHPEGCFLNHHEREQFAAFCNRNARLQTYLVEVPVQLEQVEYQASKDPHTA